MDDLQEQLARIGLRVIAGRGFVLGGGHAIELHGMGSRPSEDVDLFSPERGGPGMVADDLINRWAPRDFLDVDAILASGRYTPLQLLAVASEHNPGFTPVMFAESVSNLRQIPDREFEAYGTSEQQVARMRQRFECWEAELLA